MMAITHTAIALSGTSLILGTAAPLALGLAILGSQLPDLDTTERTISKIFFPISSWIEDRLTHRSITHSLLATTDVAAVSLLVNLGARSLAPDGDAGSHLFLLGDIKASKNSAGDLTVVASRTRCVRVRRRVEAAWSSVTWSLRPRIEFQVAPLWV